MNRPDYDFTKHIEVPEAWIEKALAVPSSCQEKTRISPFRCLIAAASVVLALGLSISLYFLFRNISVAVAPSPSSGDSRAPASVQEATVIPDYAAAPTALPTQPPAVQPTDSAPVVAPSQAPSQPAAPPVPTQRATAEPSEQPDIPAVDPTEPPAVVPDNPSTDPPAHTDPPTVPQIVSPSEKPITETGYHIEVMIPFDDPFIPASESDEDETIYCRVYSPSGYLIGDSDDYAPSHIAQTLWIGQTLYLYYIQPLPDNAYTAGAGPYQYVFYDSAGRTLLHGYC